MGLGTFWPCSHERTVDGEVPRKSAKTGWLTPNSFRVFLTSSGPSCGGGTTTTTWRTEIPSLQALQSPGQASNIISEASAAHIVRSAKAATYGLISTRPTGSNKEDTSFPSAARAGLDRPDASTCRGISYHWCARRGN
jgi:hypothetical protein